ncbi:MAG TPA: hypothetical protein VHV30_15185, partial [Polyangiaceae bacterium]|nr:hypothetical protein [Polyangiaceae bacterium]
MFGLSFGELVMLLLVAVVVLGPKEMPRYLRKAGELAGKLRRMAYDMRAKSGIDEVLRSEGIGSDIAEIRRLASFARGELGSIMASVQSATSAASLRDVAGSPYATPQNGAGQASAPRLAPPGLPEPPPPPAPLAASIPGPILMATAMAAANAAAAQAAAAAPAGASTAAAAAVVTASKGAPAGTVLAPNGKPAPAPVAASPQLVTVDRERE